MTQLVLAARRYTSGIDPAWMFLAIALLVLTLVDADQATASLLFTGDALIRVSPFLVLSIAVAAYARASGADNLIASAFSGHMASMIAMAALIGALSPFCSCGVIPLIAALLAMGVPLAPVMAFWLASPLMDPSMFLLTAGTLGTTFAVYKTAAAFGVGLFGGVGTWLLVRGGALARPLRQSAGGCGCSGNAVCSSEPVQWRFWDQADRRKTFRQNVISNGLFLGKWLTVAFFLESLMLAYIPAEAVTATLGGEGWLTVLAATLVGVPAYLNGYAALPLVGGLIEQGMAPGAGMAFLLAGGVSSIPAALAVWALARWPVFLAYISFAFVGAFGFGLIFTLFS
ncbi:permease, partial [Thiohalocapsa halophila]